MKQPPFEVMCIKPVNWDIVHKQQAASPIEVGSNYTVTAMAEDVSGLWYALKGFDPECGFSSKLFATLPSTEDQVNIEQEQEAIIYQR